MPEGQGAGGFDQIVFSGGGTRCFWHGGFLAEIRKALPLKPKRVAGVSGGAMSAAAFLGNCEDRLFRAMATAFDNLDSNVQLHKIDEAEGITPHQRIYREVVTEAIDAAAVAVIVHGPVFEVLMAHPPSARWPKWSTFPIMLAYQLDMAIRSSPQIVWPEAMGAEQIMVDARAAARGGRLVDLICNAAVIPPVFNVQRWNGRHVIDGGMTSKAPIPSDDEGETLILLTRSYRNVPRHPRRTYVAPTRETPADKIDFTSRDKIERTWEAGRRDGLAFLEERGLDRPAPERTYHQTKEGASWDG